MPFGQLYHKLYICDIKRYSEHVSEYLPWETHKMSQPEPGIEAPEQDQSADKCSRCPHTSAYPLRKTNQEHVGKCISLIKINET